MPTQDQPRCFSDQRSARPYAAFQRSTICTCASPLGGSMRAASIGMMLTATNHEASSATDIGTAT